MAKTFVIADLHGRYDLLLKAIAVIRKESDSGTIVFLGDYIDRGPESKQVVKFLQAPPPEGFKYVCLRGNHEDMAIWGQSDDDREWWLYHGGEATERSYGGRIDDSDLEWFGELPRIWWDTHRVYVHAYVNPQIQLCEQLERWTQWGRYPENADIGHEDRHVIHGHTPVVAGPVSLENRTNLDTGAYKTGKLFVAVFDDEIPGKPEKFLEVTDV